jgi:hypothetical protein
MVQSPLAGGFRLIQSVRVPNCFGLPLASVNFTRVS